MKATVQSAVVVVQGERRVFFEMPATGFGLEDLDALEAAIHFARNQLQRTHQNDKRQELLFPEPCG